MKRVEFIDLLKKENIQFIHVGKIPPFEVLRNNFAVATVKTLDDFLKIAKNCDSVEVDDVGDAVCYTGFRAYLLRGDAND